MKATTTVTCLSAAVILGIGGLGYYTQQSAQRLEEQLSFSTELAKELYTLKSIAEKDPEDQEVLALVDKELASLPEQAREGARHSLEDPEESPDTALDSALPTAVEDLYRLAVSHSDDPHRFLALDVSGQLWSYARPRTDSPGSIPGWLSDVPTAACLEGNGREDAPESVTRFTESADALLYGVQFYGARSDIDDPDGGRQESTDPSLSMSQRYRQEISQAAACTWNLPVRSAAYSVIDDTNPVASLSTLRQRLETNGEAVLADAEVPADSELFRVAAELKYSGS